jgi:hypothetical protein
MGLAMIVYYLKSQIENFWNTKMLKWPWSKQANESNHFMYTKCLLASKQAFVLVCVYLEVNSFNLQKLWKDHNL